MLQLLFVVRKWYQLLLFFLDIKVHVQSNKQKPDQLKASVVVANHISWLDIVVLGSVIPTDFLSKSEVRNWPLIGWMANQIGTLFIKRGGGGDVDGLKVQMLEYVNDGKNILFFPEGTTGKGDGLMVFRPRLFSTAIDAKANILPLAIKYGLQQGAHPVIPYGSEQTIFVNLLSVMAYGHVDVYVQFGQTISSKETNRDALANTAQKQIGNMLNLSQSQIKQRYQRTNESVAD
ncbi:lysophospholipid acyltransferase family protein [Marinicellulosiphila megalodicopiae]|uniref:lysophospholipid acyltransferase family protein n=1 Tax=Marinicellulosiphila megalodicopiae TaxID=2724896 RepID=UPI003BB1D216